MTIGDKDKRGKQPQNKNLSKELDEFYEKEYKTIYNHKKHDLKGLSFILPYICETIETCYSNNLKEHFMTRLFRYMNICAGEFYDNIYEKNKDKKDYDKEKKQTLYKLKKCLNNKEFDDIPKDFTKWFNEKKNKIFPTEFDKSIAYDCKKNPSKYIIYSLNMNAEYEKINEKTRQNIVKLQEKGKNLKTVKAKDKIKQEIKSLNSKIIKLFQPLSLRKSHVPHYVNIDTASFMNFFSDKGEKGKNLQKLKDNQNIMWSKLFKMNNKIFTQSKDYVFNYTLQTDGISCSLLFKHISIKDKKYGHTTKKIIDDDIYIDDLSNEQLDNLKNKKIVSVDPGKKNLVYMMDDGGNKLKYTCMQRDTESRNKRKREIMKINKKKSKIDELESEISDTLSTTVNFEKFKEYIKKKHEIGLKVKHFYEKELCRKLNWRTQIYRRKSEDLFLNNIEKTFGKKEDIAIVYGDWSRDTQMKYHVPTMGKGLRKLVEKNYLSMMINERNTSKKCCNCWKELVNHKYEKKNEDNEKETKYLFRVLKCENCEGVNICSSESKKCPMFITRDLNSCINMISIAKNIIYKRKRPEVFCYNNCSVPIK